MLLQKHFCSIVKATLAIIAVSNAEHTANHMKNERISKIFMLQKEQLMILKMKGKILFAFAHRYY